MWRVYRESLAVGLCVVASLITVCAWAEPYLAIRSGFSCGTCHTNPSGGGQRTAFGNLYAQQELPANPIKQGDDPWTGELLQRFAIGGNARVAARQFDVDGQDTNLDFGVDRVNLYASATLNEHVSFYLDQQVAPGGSVNREAWVKLSWQDAYVKAGRLFLPFGWRLEDDSALVRSASGVSRSQGDDGIEFGYATKTWNAQLAATNGAGGASERDDGKLLSGRFAFVHPHGQLGLSAYNNNTDTVDRTMFGIFAGFNTGPLSWLLEYDWIEDENGVDEEQSAALIEANWLLAKGHNLKITLESQNFDGVVEDRSRGSLVYEYFPWTFAQIRIGLRVRDSDDLNEFYSSEEAFLQLHAFF